MGIVGQRSNGEVSPHFFKKKYEMEEVREIIAWFESRLDKLPLEIHLNTSTDAFDLPRGVRWMINALKMHEEKLPVSFNGYVGMLQLIQFRLKEQGME